MRDPKLVRELSELATRFPTLGELRKSMPKMGQEDSQWVRRPSRFLSELQILPPS